MTCALNVAAAAQLYCTQRDGISLQTLYRKALNHAPTLLVVKDTGKSVEMDGDVRYVSASKLSSNHQQG